MSVSTRASRAAARAAQNAGAAPAVAAAAAAAANGDPVLDANSAPAAGAPQQNVQNHMHVGLDPALLLQMLQQQQQATQAQQQANELLRQEMAEMRRAQQEHSSSSSSSDSKPLPDFKGGDFKGESDEVEGWIREARQQVKRLPKREQVTERAVDFLAAGLKGPALVWFDEEVSKSASPPSTPDALFAAIRSRFQPRRAAEVAIERLHELKQGKLSVTVYTAKFRELLALLPADAFNESTKRDVYRIGLSPSLRQIVSQSATQPETLEALVEMAARIESNSKQGATSVAAMEADEPSSSPSQLLAAISSLIDNRLDGAGFNGRRDTREGSRSRSRSRAPPRRSPHRESDPLAKQSSEQRARLAERNLCFYCASPGHRRFECPLEARGTPPTAAALGSAN